MVTVEQIGEIVRFIQDYINDSNKPIEISFYCPYYGSFNLLETVKTQIGAIKSGKNSITIDHLTVFIYYKDDIWNIRIRNNDLIEPRGPM
jgi:hypothetical protein